MEILGIFKNSSDGKNFSAGEVIFEQSSKAESMFVVKQGEVEIIVNDKVIDSEAEGQIFDEMALIDNKERSATVMAKTDCEVVPIDQ